MGEQLLMERQQNSNGGLGAVRRPKVFSVGACNQLLVKVFQGVVVVIHCQPVNGESVGHDKAFLSDTAPCLPSICG